MHANAIRGGLRTGKAVQDARDALVAARQRTLAARHDYARADARAKRLMAATRAPSPDRLALARAAWEATMEREETGFALGFLDLMEQAQARAWRKVERAAQVDALSGSSAAVDALAAGAESEYSLAAGVEGALADFRARMRHVPSPSFLHNGNRREFAINAQGAGAFTRGPVTPLLREWYPQNVSGALGDAEAAASAPTFLDALKAAISVGSTEASKAAAEASKKASEKNPAVGAAINAGGGLLAFVGSLFAPKTKDAGAPAASTGGNPGTSLPGWVVPAVLVAGLGAFLWGTRK